MRANVAFHAIGQVRRDTALHDMPVQQKGRGRPRKYGEKYTAEHVATLQEHRRKVFLYGKWQWVRYRSAICLAKFMKGRRVRAVWMQFEAEDGTLSKQRLLLSTDCNLSPEEIFTYYARRWSIDIFQPCCLHKSHVSVAILLSSRLSDRSIVWDDPCIQAIA